MKRMPSAPAVALVALAISCAPAIKSTARGPLTATQMAAFWEDPKDLDKHDLFWGPWGEALAPKPGQTYHFVEEKTTGFSPGFTVKDDEGIEWSIKQGPEAHTEVVVSRLLSALGYHQPPVYYVEQWTQRGGPEENQQKSGRFRPKHVGLDDKGSWSWQKNPFVGTRPYGGLLAFLMLVNSTDLKNDNNTLYDVGKELKLRSVNGAEL